MKATASLRKNPHLYEINTWTWLERLSAKLGRNIRLGDVPDAEWDAIAERGFNIVWLMGIWRRSAIARQIALEFKPAFAAFDRALPGWKPSDIVASPYSVAEYVPDARIGNWDGLDGVREKLRARGIALCLDFVGNHTALDHPWVHDHPEYYVQGTEQNFQNEPDFFYRAETAQGEVVVAHGKDPYYGPWTDTAQLNHFHPGMRAAEIATLRTIAAHCDSVRCDMAMLHLSDIFERIWGYLLHGMPAPAHEFWQDAHEAVPNLVLLAEAYWETEGRLLDLGFSFTYNKGLYDAVRDIHVSDVRNILQGDIGFQNHMARSLENHDEARCAAVFGPQRLRSVGTLMGTLPGMRFYHQGELEGRAIFQPITLRMAVDEPPNPPSEAFFQKILQISNEEVFHSGEWRMLPIWDDGRATARNLVAYEWFLGNVWKVIVVNLTPDAGQGRIPLTGRVARGQAYVFHDEDDGERYYRDGDELTDSGLFVYRDGYQVHLFDVTLA